MAKAKEKAKTIGELRKSGYQVISVKEELRRNLIWRIEKKEEILPGIEKMVVETSANETKNGFSLSSLRVIQCVIGPNRSSNYPTRR